MRKRNNWQLIKGQPLTELDKKILYLQNKGHLVPSRKLIKTEEQIEGIRRSGGCKFWYSRFSGKGNKSRNVDSRNRQTGL